MLYTNLKKCRFYQEKLWFFSYIVSLEGIHIFANFYRQFIQGLSGIAALLTLMLKTSNTKSIEPKRGGVGVAGNNTVEYGGRC